MATRRKARFYEIQEKYAEAMNAARKNDGIIRFHCPARAEEDLIPVESPARQIPEEPIHSSRMRRAVDEL